MRLGGCYGHAETTPMLPSRKQWIVSLLHDWGFNTSGCWSNPSVWPYFYVTEQIYTHFLPQAHHVFDASFWQGPYADHLRDENGHDPRQPSAARCTKSESYRPIPLRVVQHR